ncbi:TonB family protein [Pseudoduganella violaceinigra]|uniref:TonB family protein n=1 Tax=Pseudoduganella violaceinigra TaxID=246602 RepID=UPI0003F9C584|nr:TonB family protein [Pseudoduganella violaceinigra]
MAFGLLVAAGAANAELPAAPNRTVPVLIFDSCRKPEWPRESLRNEETGTVSLSMLIGTNGKVKDAKLLASSGSSLLDEAAMAGLRTCTFKPGTEGGQAIESWQKMQYVWTIEESAPPEEYAAMKRLQQNDFDGAAALFRTAAVKGSANAQFYLGAMLFFGNGVKQDKTEAAKWMEQAVAQGHVKAKGALGAMLLEQGSDDRRAYALLQAAANGKDVTSMYWLATCLERGRGTSADLGDAKAWYKRAAEGGHPKAKQALARLEGGQG